MFEFILIELCISRAWAKIALKYKFLSEFDLAKIKNNKKNA